MINEIQVLLLFSIMFFWLSVKQKKKNQEADKHLLFQARRGITATTISMCGLSVHNFL